MGEIRRIERVSYNAGSVERVTRYSPEERAAKIREIEQAAADRASCSGAISVLCRALLRLWTGMRDGVLDANPSSAVY